MKTQTRLAVWFTTLIVLMATLGGASSASAAPPEHRRAPAASNASAVVSAPAAHGAGEHWTPARMAAALPGDLLLADRPDVRSRSVATGAPRVVGPTSPAHHRPGHAGGPGGGRGNGNGNGNGNGTVTVTGSTWTGGGEVADTTGKVFFTLDSVDYVCSGSSVSAANNLVLTAGHCIHEGAGGTFVDNWAFVPAYSGSGGDLVGPHGVWSATELFTTSAWATAGDFAYDVGFAVVEGEGDEALADVVGAQGIAFNQGTDVGHHVYAFGYPHASPYDGTTLTYCAGTTVADTWGGLSTQGVRCDMTGGASGGPWYADFDAEVGQGTAVSVSSYRYLRGRDRHNIYGPFFGAQVAAVYDDAQG